MRPTVSFRMILLIENVIRNLDTKLIAKLIATSTRVERQRSAFALIYMERCLSEII